MSDLPFRALIDADHLVDDAVAVQSGHDVITYRDLRSRVAKLAAVLVSLGVGPLDRVAVHLSTSWCSVVAVHAVLRAGAVMVPVDPRAPLATTAGVLHDAGVSALITDAELDRLQDLVDTLAQTGVTLPSIVGPDQAPSDVMHRSWSDVDGTSEVPRVPVSDDKPAYIIYTSGSTGAPKGIVHTGRSGRCYAELAVATYGIDSSDVIATLSPLHFDQSTFSLYAAPLGGASVVMAPDPVLRFPASLTQLIADAGVTIWYSAPTVLLQALSRGVITDRDLSALRWVLFGGEVFPPRKLAELMDRLPSARFSNVYGPAEVNQCTYHHLGPGGSASLSGEEVVPIGRAWPRTEILVVDEALVPCADGDPGELLVRTETAMEGYWQRPDLTDRCFVELPDTGIGAWYRTRDLATRQPDGTHVFLGRSDNQVKIRGHRVEIEAVESALMEIPGIESAAVVVVGDIEDRSLVGVVEGRSDLDATAIISELRRRLVPAAVPDTVMCVEALPRTPTGKVDRTATLFVVQRAALQ